eukprot:366260-Chlamydomonas_euryale.AAC.34
MTAAGWTHRMHALPACRPLRARPAGKKQMEPVLERYTLPMCMLQQHPSAQQLPQQQQLFPADAWHQHASGMHAPLHARVGQVGVCMTLGPRSAASRLAMHAPAPECQAGCQRVGRLALFERRENVFCGALSLPWPPSSRSDRARSALVASVSTCMVAVLRPAQSGSLVSANERMWMPAATR